MGGGGVYDYYVWRFWEFSFCLLLVLHIPFIIWRRLVDRKSLSWFATSLYLHICFHFEPPFVEYSTFLYDTWLGYILKHTSYIPRLKATLHTFFLCNLNITWSVSRHWSSWPSLSRSQIVITPILPDLLYTGLPRPLRSDFPGSWSCLWTNRKKVSLECSQYDHRLAVSKE